MRRRVGVLGDSVGRRRVAPVVLKGGLLMCWDGELQRYSIVVPTCLRGRLVVAVQERLIHLGMHKTLAVLKLDYFGPGMAADVANIINGCAQCARQKAVAR